MNKHRFDNDVLRRAYSAVIEVSGSRGRDEFEINQALAKEIIELDKKVAELEVVIADLGSRY